MGGIGEMLRTAREAKGLTLHQAEEDTKIRKRYLEALEQEDYDVIPGRVYAKGFLRNYANYLGLNQEEIMMEYKILGLPVKEEFQKVNIEDTINKRRSNGRAEKRTYLITVFVALLAIITLVVYNNTFRAAGGGNEDADKPQVNQNTKNNPSNDKPADENGAQPKPSVPGQVYQPTPPPQSTNNIPPAGQTPGQVNLTLNGKNQVCWAKVVVDGATKFIGNIKPNESKSFSGAKIVVTLGNAGAVEVVKDGRSLGYLAPMGEVVKNKEFVPDTAAGNAPQASGTTGTGQQTPVQ